MPGRIVGFSEAVAPATPAVGHRGNIFLSIVVDNGSSWPLRIGMAGSCQDHLISGLTVPSHATVMPNGNRPRKPVFPDPCVLSVVETKRWSTSLVKNDHTLRFQVIGLKKSVISPSVWKNTKG